MLENEEKLKLELSVKDLHDIVKGTIENAIKSSLSKNTDQINTSIDTYFHKAFLQNKESQFETALDWAVENAFRLGLEQAMNELNYKELIASKCKEILLDNDFISKLAESKVRSSLGLPSNGI